MPRKYKLNENYFSEIDTEEQAYWLGFILADGCVSKENRRNCISIALSSRDKEQLLKFKLSLGTTYDIKYKFVTVKGKKHHAARISLYSRKMKEDLIALGCGPQKSKTAIFTKKIRTNLIKHFVRGIFGGDGSLSCSGRLWRIDIVGTEDVTRNILNIFKTLTGSKGKLVRRGNAYCCYIGGINYVKTIMDWLYEDATIYLDRKYDKYLELLQAIIETKSRKEILWQELSQSMKGKEHSIEVKQKMSIARRGKKKSEEHKQKIRVSNKKRFESQDARKAVSGENSSLAKLSKEMVIRVRLEFENGGITRKELASKYNINYSTIRDVLSMRTWKYL